MKAIRLHEHSGPAGFVYEEAEQPQPGEGEIVVRVHAVAVTPTELNWVPTLTARSGEPRPLPIIPGHEFSGVVSAVGPKVVDLTTGDAVFGMNDWCRDGAQAEYCVARVDEVARKPLSVDHLHAAVTPISALTAWQGLIGRAKLAAGQRVLVHGASGAVGVFAVQLAHWRSAHVIGTASAKNLEFVRGLGADETVDYRAQGFEDVVGKVDVVFDTVGGDTLARSWDVLKPGGTAITIVSPQTREQRVRNAFFIVEPRGSELAEIARLIDAGAIRPVVGAVFPLAQARQAYEHKALRGKVVLRVIDEAAADAPSQAEDGR